MDLKQALLYLKFVFISLDRYHRNKSAIFLLFASVLLQAQTQSQYRALEVPIADFFANKSIKVVCQDHMGVLWIGTQNGIYTYDGVAAQPFVLNGDKQIESNVFSIVEDDNRRLWICTVKGVWVLTPNRSMALTPEQIGIPPALLSSANFSVCPGPNGQLFMLSKDSIYTYQKNQINQWTKLPDGLIPVTSASMYFVYKDQSLVIHSKLQRTIFHVARNGNIKRIQKGASLTFAHVGNDSLYAIKNSLNFKCSYLYYNNIIKDFSDCPAPYVLSKFIDPVKNTVRQQSNLKILHLNEWRIFPLMNDHWAVTCNKGLFIVHRLNHLFAPIRASEGTRVRGITTDKYDNMIYGTYTGLYWYNLKTGRSGLISKDAIAIWTILPTDHNNDRFIAAGEGWKRKFIFLKSTQKGVFLDSIQVINNQYSQCNSIIRDHYGEGYWGVEGNDTTYNVYYLHPKTFKIQYVSPDIRTTGVRSLAQSKDLWIGSSNGLFRAELSNDKQFILSIGKQQIHGALQHAVIHTMYADKNGGLWIGTQGTGLFYYHFNNQTLHQYTKLDGLPDNTIYSLLAAGDSVLWIGTGNGLSRFDLQKKWFQNYYQEDGLSENEFNTAAAHLTREGTMLMGGQNGINRFDPRHFYTTRNYYPIFLQITLGKANGQSEKLYITDSVGVILTPDVNVLEISFRSSNIARAAKRYFRYRISGLTDQWHYIQASDKAIFGKLPNGNYLIEVQSQSFRGMWMDSSFFSVSVLPPWYKTWWFSILLTVSIFSLLYGLYRLRIQYLRREFEVRQQISHDLHDDLGSRIYLLRSLSHQIANPLLRDQERVSTIKKFETISQDTLKSIRDFIWAFDPQRDEVNDLLDRMDDFAENYLSPIIEQVEISRPAITQNPKINPRFKYHLMNIYQELLTNMVKHTFCTKINILLTYQGNAVKIRIENQHQGYRNNHEPTENDATTGQGMSSIRHRIRELNGKMDWQETDGNKQSVTLYLPL